MNYKGIIFGASLVIAGALLIGFGLLGAIWRGGIPTQGSWYDMLPGISMLIGACSFVLGFLMMWIDRLN